MKTGVVSALGAVLFAAALALPIPSEAQHAAPGIPGTLNPVTGTFTARPALATATTGLQRAGTITVNTTVTLGSNIPAAAPIVCNVDISSFDSEYNNRASGAAVLRRSAGGGTCSVKIPYTFEIATTATPLSISVSVAVNTTTAPSLSYSASFSFSPFAVPDGNNTLSVALAM